MPAILRLLLVAILAGPAILVAAQPPLPAGTPVDPAYRAQFATCDATNVFQGVTIATHGCKSDPSRLGRLDRIDASGGRPAAILFVAKMAWDEDGSPEGCRQTGTNQCATSLMLRSTATTKCNPKIADRPYCVPVDAATIPYVVKPGFTLWGKKAGRRAVLIDGSVFATKTGIDRGDYGVVLSGPRIVPVIVADNGPAYKIGEGSTALLAALSSDGRPHVPPQVVTYLIFPGTRETPRPLPDGLARHVACMALGYYDVFTGKTKIADRQAALAACLADH